MSCTGVSSAHISNQYCYIGTHVEVGGDGDDGVGDLLAEVGLSNLLHLAKNHGGDFLGRKVLVFAGNLDLNEGLAILGDNLVGEVLDIGLDLLLVELATNETPVDNVSIN